MATSYPDKRNQLWNLQNAYKLELENSWSTMKGDRGIFSGGVDPASNVIEYTSFASAGNTTDFGDCTITHPGGTGSSNTITAIIAGGASYAATADTFNIQTTGNATEFGDLSVGRVYAAGYGNNTRGVVHAGTTGSVSAVIDYVHYASLGNYADFGDSTQARLKSPVGMSNGVRGLAAGGATPTIVNTIDYVNIASVGNAVDYGDLSAATASGGGSSNSIRGFFGGGIAPSATNKIEYIDLASTGNGVDQGDLSGSREGLCGTSSETKGLFGGGYQGGIVNTIESIQIATNANAINFGDLTVGRQSMASGISNCHGGITRDDPRAPELYSPTGRPLHSNGIGTGDIGLFGRQTALQWFNISSLGNTQEFGTASANTAGAAVSSSTRAIINVGSSGDGTIFYVQFSTKGNTSDFGDVTSNRANLGGFCSAT